MKYGAEDLRRLSGLLDEALDLTEPEREAWLAELRGDAAVFRPALRKMLASHSSVETDGILDGLPAFTAPGGEARTNAFEPGDEVGPYRLIRVIGHGGMGEVWLAERSDGQLKRSVALKLPTLSVRRSVLARRFQRERDILAALVHPNIARLYDAGLAEDGQPFMALEYVEGTPITKAADDKGLDGKARVGLLRQVMDAVQYAHANLVIHRDLKPDNVLVTVDGKAKLLDFGIAKLVEDEASTASETELTRLGGRALTLQYAAPEQVSGEPVSTATDVWALGVLLYELMTGMRPFVGKGRSTLEREVMQGEPVRPSQRKAGTMASLSRGLAADLDTIVMKALKKAPAERYATVSSFADDLDRWLQGDPVHAQRDSAWYRTRKFVGRHRLPVAAATLAVIALIGTASVAVVFGLQAREESARAIAARDFMVDMFRRTDPDLSQGREVSAKQLLVQGYDTVLATMQGQPRLQSDLLTGIGLALTSMEDFRAADNAYMQAALRYAQAGRPREAAAVILDRAELRLAAQWEVPGAASLLEEAEKAYPAHADDEEFSARHSIDRAFAAYLAGDMNGVKTWYERARPYADRALGDTTSRTVTALRILAGMEGHLGDYQAAIDRLDVLLERLHRQSSSPSDVLGVQGDIALIEHLAGRYRASLERYDAAAAYCQRSLNVSGNQCVYAAQFQRSRVMLALGYHERALDSVPYLLPRPGSTRASRGWDTFFLVQAYEILGRNGQLARYPEVASRVQATGESTQAMPRSGRLLSLVAQTRTLLQEGRPEQAKVISDRAQAVVSALGLDDDRSAVRAHLLHGMTSHALGQHDAAARIMDRAYAAQAGFYGTEHPVTQLVSVHRARALWAMHRKPEALQLLDHAMPILEKAMGADAPVFIRLAGLREELATTSPRSPEDTRKVDLFM